VNGATQRTQSSANGEIKTLRHEHKLSELLLINTDDSTKLAPIHQKAQHQLRLNIPIFHSNLPSIHRKLVGMFKYDRRRQFRDSVLMEPKKQRRPLSPKTFTPALNGADRF
jgi:hypothetical protein